MKLVKIPIPELKEMEGKNFIELRPYVHKNPIVRWLFWRRLKTVLNLAETCTCNKNCEKVLDFGAGSGIFMPTLSKNFKSVYSLDRNTDSLKYVKQKYKLENVTISNSPGETLPYNDNFFDLIIAADVLEHFQDSRKIQEEFLRVLKKGGCLIVSGPTENFLYRLARKFIYRYKKPADHYSDVEKIIKISSRLFRIEKVKTLPVFFIPGFKIYRAKKM